jgi:hypothetical protein
MSNGIVHVREDLIGASVLTNNQLVQAGVIASFGGTATLLTNTATEMGYQQLTAGAGTTNKSGLTSSATGLTFVLSTASRFYASIKFGLPFLTDGTTKYKGMMGLTSTPNDVTGTSALAFWVDQTAPVANLMVAIGSGSVTPVATNLATVALGASTLYHVEIDKPAGADVANFAVNGALVHTASSGIPNGTPMGWYCGIVKNAGGGTTAGINIDWIDLMILPSSPRNGSAFT